MESPDIKIRDLTPSGCFLRGLAEVGNNGKLRAEGRPGLAGLTGAWSFVQWSGGN
jgi:hypothetical protein